MPEIQIQVPFISATTGKLRIEVEHINGQGGPIYPQLFVPLQVSVTSGEVSPRIGRGGIVQAPEDLMQDCSLHRISGVLIIGSGQVAQFQSPPISHFSRNSPEVQVTLAIPLDLQRLQLIEAQRVGDIALRFDCTFEDARKYKGTPKNGPGTNPSFADKIDYLLSTLPGVPTGDRGANFARRIKDLWWLTSRPEHPDSPHFTRDDAELTLHHTIADLSYLGKFLARATEAEIQAAAQLSAAAVS